VILEDINVKPCLFSEADCILWYQPPKGAVLRIPAKSDKHAADIKAKLNQFYNISDAMGIQDVGSII
jgi:hypothetical protein